MKFSTVIKKDLVIKCDNLQERAKLFNICKTLGIELNVSECITDSDYFYYITEDNKLIHPRFEDIEKRMIWFEHIVFNEEDNVLVKELLSPNKKLEKEFTHNFEGKEFVENMNISALNNKYDKCVLRDNEINRVCEILMKKHKCNPVLIGRPGVGKTAIVEALAQKIVKLKRNELNGGNPHPFSNKTIFNLNLNAMVSGAKYRGDFEERLENVVNYASSNPDIILFIDELHNIVNLNNSETAGTTSVGQTLKQPLTRGEICVIGATTDAEYDVLTSDKALARRFMPVYVKEFTKSQMKSILSTISENYLDFHKIKLSKNFMLEALDYCDNYCENGVYPDKFVDLIDETFAKVRLAKWNSKTIKVTIDGFCQTLSSQTGKIIIPLQETKI